MSELDIDDEVNLTLRCHSLDYAGEIMLGDVAVGSFSNTFLPVEADLTEAWAGGHRQLSVVFTDVPDDLGQIGWTSKRRAWKPRFNYGWDWTPRMVQVAIAGPIGIDLISGPAIERLDALASYSSVTSEASVHVKLSTSGCLPDHSIRVRLVDPVTERIVATADHPAGEREFHVPVDDVTPWTVCPSGPAQLYHLHADLVDPAGEQLDSAETRVGFRDISWSPCEGAPPDAAPWICNVNGEPLFLQGVNWVPVRPDYADVTDDMIRQRLLTYRDLGVNLIRVWGGAAMERAAFYDTCDELGLLVWQELPLSSSGLDNLPPADDEFAAGLAEIASHYARQLRHHAALALWCGGNELAVGAYGGDPVRPVDVTHPALAAAAAVLGHEDPGRRFLPSSPSGPGYIADPENFGLGVHHDVHGPWVHDGSADQWAGYWDRDDALMRSEVGIAGSSSVDLLTAFGLAPDHVTLDAIRADWSHSSGWWLAELDSTIEEQGLEAWVHASQNRQATLLEYAAAATKRRFPRCGGFIVWMGHDTFPCAVSLSILDFWGRPKPAALAIRGVFTGLSPQPEGVLATSLSAHEALRE
ncbi:hypothetical protein J7E89_05180 [Streptomyces sp. ISL-100]|nr:glycoside hydrolase family 2 TIM barrel-domain containing protein [Streptomyces sp. ISL-100]MBT2395384.1 hypothetical protein [Streptomyces sp. ISL-100]